MLDKDIKIRIGGDMAQLSDVLKNARHAIGTQTNAMATSLNKAKLSFNSTIGGITKLHGALAGLGVVLSSGAIVNGFMNIANAMDRMEEASQKTGVGVEGLQVFGMAAKLASVDSEQLTKGLVLLQRRMYEFTQGLTDPVTAFNALGVSVKKASGELKLTDDVFLELADKFAQMPDGAEKAAIATKVFGRAGAELIPMLNMGRDGIMKLREEMGYLFTQDDANRAAVFTDNIDIMKRMLEGTKMQIVSGMLPAMLSLTESFKAGAKEGAGFGDIGTFIGDTIKYAAGQVYGFIRNVQLMTVGVAAFFDKFRAIRGMSRDEKLDKNAMREKLKPVTDAEEWAKKEIEAKYKARMDALNKPVSIPKPRKRGGGAGYIEDETEKATKAAKATKSEADKAIEQGERAIEGLIRQIALTGEVSKADEMRWDTTYGQYKGLSEAHKQRLIELSEEIDMVEANKEREKEATEAFEEARKNAVDKANEKMREIESILESIKTPQDQYNEQVARLNELLAEGALTWDVYQTAMAKAKETLDKTVQDGQDKFTELKQVIEGWGKQSADAIVDFCMTGKTSFTDMINSMIADLMKMVVYQNITNRIASGISGWLEGGSFWESLLGAATSGKKASGGAVSAGRMYEVNERGIPELLNIGNRQFLMMSNQSGMVNNLSDSGSSPTGGTDNGNVTIINNNISAMDARSMHEVFRRNAAEITTVINDSLKSNSGLRSTIKRTR